MNHFCTGYALCSFEYGNLLELYVRRASLYRTFILRLFMTGNNSKGLVVGRVWGMVVGQGPHKQKTLRHTKSGHIRGDGR